jgi:hypothetical protein
MDKHVDLVRNDWLKRQQEVVATIRLEPGAAGAIVKDATSKHYEGNIFDSIGDDIRKGPEQIVNSLIRSFHAPYLVATGAHGQDECPFRFGPTVPIESERVEGRFELPAL